MRIVSVKKLPFTQGGYLYLIYDYILTQDVRMFETPVHGNPQIARHKISPDLSDQHYDRLKLITILHHVV